MNLFRNLLLPLSLGASLLLAAPAHAQPAQNQKPEVPFTLTSNDISETGSLGNMHVYTECGGRNMSPVLTWSYPPEGTKSFAITMFDKTANGGAGWLHWIVLNIPAETRVFPRGMGMAQQPLPDGVNVIPNSWGHAGYDGPCPPAGDDREHQYIITIYAMAGEHLEYPLNGIGQSTLNWLEDNALSTATVKTRYLREP